MGARGPCLAVAQRGMAAAPAPARLTCACRGRAPLAGVIFGGPSGAGVDGFFAFCCVLGGCAAAAAAAAACPPCVPPPPAKKR